jgi:hypothetical protein
MPYSYTSALEAMRDNPSLECVPPVPHCPNSVNVGWCEPLFNPKDCADGNAQKCGQKLTVRTERGGIYNLYFYFKVSPDNQDGFINENDNQLNFLIQNKIVQRENLRRV